MIPSAPTTSRNQIRKAIDAINSVCAAARPLLEDRLADAQQKLDRKVSDLEAAGRPFAFRQVLGKKKEPYLNRLLAWIIDPNQDHGAGTFVLQELVRNKDCPVLIDDLDRRARVEVRCEKTWPEGARSDRMPDLLVLTPRAALLIENKLRAPETGFAKGDDEKQFVSYRHALSRLAERKGLSEYRSFLLFPSGREFCKDGWINIEHAEVASLLRKVAKKPRLPAWGRVACMLAALDFEEGSLSPTTPTICDLHKKLNAAKTDHQSPVSLLAELTNLNENVPDAVWPDGRCRV